MNIALYWDKLKVLLYERSWIANLPQPSGIRGFLSRLLQLILWAINKFLQDKCLLRASALTYSTLLSMVPVLALMLSILKGLGVQNRLEPIILEKLTGGSEEVIYYIIKYIDNTNVTSLGVFGLLSLVFTAIILLGNVEKSFNEIWRAEKERSFFRKFSDYLSVLIISPIILLAVMSLTTAFQSQTLVQKLLDIEFINQIFFFLLKLAPLFFIWVLFAFLYMFIPNTSIHFTSAILGSVVAGPLWQLAQRAYINFQFGMAKYNAIYGAIAQLPILLVWLYLSWVIVLFGSEVAFVCQNFKTFRTFNGEKGIDSLCNNVKELMSLKIILALAENFYLEKGPQTAESLSQELSIPVFLVKELLAILIQGGLISEISKDSIIGYQPAKPLEKILIKEVLDTIKRYPNLYLSQERKEEEFLPEGILTKVDKAVEEALQGLTVRDVVLKKEGQAA
jgi:membrane protein